MRLLLGAAALALTAAAATGARMLVVVNDGVGRLAPWTTSDWGPVDPPPITVIGKPSSPPQRTAAIKSGALPTRTR